MQYRVTNRGGLDFGLLSLDEQSGTWSLRINPECNWENTPLSLAIYIKSGIRELNAQQSLSWVRDRLLPPNRQNIYYVLNGLDLEQYDEAALIAHTRGVSPNDDLYLEPITS
ncbi:MAG: hypothetical protein LBR39_03415 [Coriobacteriales bacterium]|jgi:hypothetical protein|nr:hypothetical protein [Coriobacteriales bacterium]